MRVPGLVLLLWMLVLLGHPETAFAHRLKVFATVESGRVSGYGFFVGGGRAIAARVSATAGGEPIVEDLPVDAEGRFAFAHDGPGPLRITMDAGEGHRAELLLPAGFPVAAPGATGSGAAAACPADGAALAALIDARVEAVVARHTRPLAEALAEAEARLRFSDVVAGIGMILGMAGVAAWVAARRRDASSS